MVASNRPAAQSAGYGIVVSFGAGALFSSVNRVASSRTVSGGLVGTSQPRPHARSVVAAVTRAVAMSLIEVQLCGSSSFAGTQARLPASSGLANTKLKIELASM